MLRHLVSWDLLGVKFVTRQEIPPTVSRGEVGYEPRSLARKVYEHIYGPPLSIDEK
jgi:hypothetical protein